MTGVAIFMKKFGGDPSPEHGKLTSQCPRQGSQTASLKITSQNCWWC